MKQDQAVPHRPEESQAQQPGQAIDRGISKAKIRNRSVVFQLMNLTQALSVCMCVCIVKIFKMRLIRKA